MIETAIASQAQGRTLRASGLAATWFCLAALLAPALWNGYPLLQYDTGGYLARWYEGYLVPSRSTVYGLFLHLGEGVHFWPELMQQAAWTVWVIWLSLRVFGLGASPWLLAAVVAALSVLTALPVLSSMLLTDIFVGLAVLALYLLIFHRAELRRYERSGLFLLIAFAAATHSATFAVLLAVLGFCGLVLVLSGARLLRVLPAAGAIATGAAMLLAANFALSGQLAWSAGGFGIAFGRMLQDGIVERYLDDHCPDARLKLCPYRDQLPKTADDFLWNYGIFNDLGRFTGLGDEMRLIVLNSVREYPLQQIETALAATARQLGLVATGYGTHDQIWHTYGIIKRFIPDEVPAMQKARQQRRELHVDALNRVHVPIALGSMLLVLVLLAAALARRRFDEPVLLAATVAVALLANAFVCGALSGPHDRYGARIAWIATFTVVIAALQAIRSLADERTIGAAP
jgi:MFS family permease